MPPLQKKVEHRQSHANVPIPDVFYQNYFLFSPNRFSPKKHHHIVFRKGSATFHKFFVCIFVQLAPCATVPTMPDIQCFLTRDIPNGVITGGS